MRNPLGIGQSKRVPLLAVASLAVVAATAGCGQSPSLVGQDVAAIHPVRHAALPVRHAAPAAQALRRPATGHATFHRWWAGPGRAQFTHVARDLQKIILTDVVRDKDSTFAGDLNRLVTDATAALGNPPPVGAASYLAAMRDFRRAGQTGLGGSYARAYAAVRVGLAKMGVFITAAKLKSLSIRPMLPRCRGRARHRARCRQGRALAAPARSRTWPGRRAACRCLPSGPARRAARAAKEAPAPG